MDPSIDPRALQAMQLQVPVQSQCDVLYDTGMLRWNFLKGCTMYADGRVGKMLEMEIPGMKHAEDEWKSVVLS